MKHSHAAATAAPLLVVASTLCFSITDTSFKYLTQAYPVLLLIGVRWSLQALALVAWLVPKVGIAGLVRTRRPQHHVLRGGLLLASSMCFMGAIKYLPIADATALNYSAPVIVTIMAAMFLNERMTRPRIAFIVAGIAGMLLIVRPGSSVFQGASLLALCAAGFYATFQIMTRRLAAEDWRVSMFVPSLVGTIVMAFLVPFVEWPQAWRWQHVALMVAVSVVATFGHLLFLRAFQRGSASALSPFTYSQLIWATAIGWVVFGTLPDRWTVIGAAVIVASGVLIMLHERRRAGERRAPETVAPAPAAVD